MAGEATASGLGVDLMLAHQIDPTPSAAPGSPQMLTHLSPGMSRRCM